VRCSTAVIKGPKRHRRAIVSRRAAVELAMSFNDNIPDPLRASMLKPMRRLPWTLAARFSYRVSWRSDNSIAAILAGASSVGVEGRCIASRSNSALPLEGQQAYITRAAVRLIPTCMMDMQDVRWKGVLVSSPPRNA
jgi:hypothetical protein